MKKIREVSKTYEPLDKSKSFICLYDVSVLDINSFFYYNILIISYLEWYTNC